MFLRFFFLGYLQTRIDFVYDVLLLKSHEFLSMYAYRLILLLL